MPPDNSPTSGACIFDDAGPYYIDQEFVKLGIEEGWLTLDGYFLNEYRVWTFHYKLKRAPP